MLAPPPRKGDSRERHRAAGRPPAALHARPFAWRNGRGHLRTHCAFNSVPRLELTLFPGPNPVPVLELTLFSGCGLEPTLFPGPNSVPVLEPTLFPGPNYVPVLELTLFPGPNSVPWL